MNFNEILIRERKKRGLSQEELAAKVQVSRQSVSKWETADAMPDLNKLMTLADALEISLDELCGRDEYIAEKREKTAEKGKKRPYIIAAIAIIICAFGLWNSAQKDKERDMLLEKQFEVLAENFSVSGVNFYGQPDNCLNYQFIPNAYGEGLKYKITFTDADGKSYTFDTENSGGIYTGTAKLDNNGGYTVAVSVVYGEFSKNVAVAMNLKFSDNESSWTPVEQ